MNLKSAQMKLFKGFTLKRELINVRLKGFTLIELLVVIAILGILAAAVLVAVNPTKRTNQAQDAQRKNDIGALATELQGYYTTPGSGCYPDTAGELTAQGYLKQMPTQPGGAAYLYVTSASPAICTGANGPTEVALYATLSEPNSGVKGTTVWCWRSSTGAASEATAGSGGCTAP